MFQPPITQVIDYLFHSNTSTSHNALVYSIGLIYYVRCSNLGPGEMADLPNLSTSTKVT